LQKKTRNSAYTFTTLFKFFLKKNIGCELACRSTLFQEMFIGLQTVCCEILTFEVWAKYLTNTFLKTGLIPLIRMEDYQNHGEPISFVGLKIANWYAGFIILIFKQLISARLFSWKDMISANQFSAGEYIMLMTLNIYQTEVLFLFIKISINDFHLIRSQRCFH
jgi:hypothetical protein